MGNVDPFDEDSLCHLRSQDVFFCPFITLVFFVCQGQDGHGDLLVEPAGTAAAGVEEDGVSVSGAGIAVAVAVDDQVRLVVLRDVALDMGHADSAPEEVEGEDLGQAGRPVPSVVIAPHDVEGFQLFQAVQDVECGDIACMDDDLAGPDDLDHLRAKEIMRIGNHSDSVHFYYLPGVSL